MRTKNEMIKYVVGIISKHEKNKDNTENEEKYNRNEIAERCFHVIKYNYFRVYSLVLRFFMFFCSFLNWKCRSVNADADADANVDPSGVLRTNMGRARNCRILVSVFRCIISIAKYVCCAKIYTYY